MRIVTVKVPSAPSVIVRRCTSPVGATPFVSTVTPATSEPPRLLSEPPVVRDFNVAGVPDGVLVTTISCGVRPEKLFGLKVMI